MKPNWIKVKVNINNIYNKLNKKIKYYNLHTVCKSSSCPNIFKCWKNKNITFMILGNICTRTCKFCSVKKGIPNYVDIEEPIRICNIVKELNMKHIVITSVSRDDLKDMGINIWCKTIKLIKKLNKNITIEALIPDFNNKTILLKKIINSKPDIISHNIETIERLSKKIRVKASYNKSINVLKKLKDMSNNIRIKTGIMLGLGEKKNEIIDIIKRLKEINIDILTIGQYLQPSKYHIPVKRYIPINEFKFYKELGIKLGFMYVESGPLIRSSYNSNKHVL